MKQRSAFFVIASLCALWLAGCATAPKLDVEGAEKEASPKQVVDNIDTYQGRRVVWAGVIINSQNLEQGTMLEVLAYPLESDLSPATQGRPRGRFIAKHSEYLETVDYAPGRLVTVVGAITDKTTGMVGETEYHYPVMNVNQIHLWPTDEQRSRGGVGTSFHFGIGIRL